MEKLELKKYNNRLELVGDYSFPIGKDEEIGTRWFMIPLASQLKEFKTGLGKITYFETEKRDLLETPYVEELESRENRKEIMYKMITDYILLSEFHHAEDCDCGCAEENRASLLKLDGFDDCYLGISESYGELPALIYDQQKILENLQSDGMSLEESQEFYDFNILGSYLGEKMPIFLNRIPLEDLS